MLAGRNQTQSLACAWESLKKRWSASTESCRGTVGARYRSGAACGAMDLEPAASANQISCRRCRRTLEMPPEATTAPLQRPSFPNSSRYSACPLFLAPACLARGSSQPKPSRWLDVHLQTGFLIFSLSLFTLHCRDSGQNHVPPRRSLSPVFLLLISVLSARMI